MVQIRKIREAITLALIVIFVGFAVYSILGLAWTFKTAVEATEKFKRSI
jgi:hypothetical protein